jgi:hypothetical protein
MLTGIKHCISTSNHHHGNQPRHLQPSAGSSTQMQPSTPVLQRPGYHTRILSGCTNRICRASQADRMCMSHTSVVEQKCLLYLHVVHSPWMALMVGGFAGRVVVGAHPVGRVHQQLSCQQNA